MQLLQRGEEDGVVPQQMLERNVAEKTAAKEKEASPESGDVEVGTPLVAADEIEVWCRCACAAPSFMLITLALHRRYA